LGIIQNPAFAMTSLEEVSQRFGVSLISDIHNSRTDWTEAESDAVLAALTSLPQPIAMAFKLGTFGRVEISKGLENPTDATSQHVGTRYLKWRMHLDLSDLNSDPKTPRQLRIYLGALKKRMIHQALHQWEANGEYSHRSEWLAISGWRRQEILGIEIPTWIWRAENQDLRNYASNMGLLSPEEDLITYMESIFFVPSRNEDARVGVKCRNGKKYLFARGIFPEFIGHLELDKTRCPAIGADFFSDIRFVDPINQTPIEMGDFSEESISGFELLYATPGVQDAAEIAGHLILRVKLKNNPTASKLQMENPRDVVISFLADTEAKIPPAHNKVPDQSSGQCQKRIFDFLPTEKEGFDAISSMVGAVKGLTGGFLTVFDRSTLEQVIKNYTQSQDRNLLRYELHLNADEKRALIAELAYAKGMYRTPYYFFDRNCASVLVRLIGRGIGDRELRDFDPVVIPPNTLLALMMRRGLVTQVYPSFYSYKKRAAMAQDLLANRLASLRTQYGNGWNHDPQIFVNPKVSERIRALVDLEEWEKSKPESRQEVLKISYLIQASELAFQDREDPCNVPISEPTRIARKLANGLLLAQKPSDAFQAIDLNAEIDRRLSVADRENDAIGTDHTELSTVSIGIARSSGSTPANDVVFSGTAYRQEMGSHSMVSMQRATAVVLGEGSLLFDVSKRDDPKLSGWSIKGLEIRKFRERVSAVPRFFDRLGKLGLGLTVLNVRKDKRLEILEAHLVKGEMLFNLLSDRFYEDYLFVSAGVGIDHFKADREELNLGLGIEAPLRLELLLTLTKNRRLLLRSAVEATYFQFERAQLARLQESASLAWVMTEVADPEVVLKITAKNEANYFEHATALDRVSVMFSVDLNHY
jgi:hypothetical protein